MTSDQRDTNERDDHAGVAFHPPLLLLLFIVLGFVGRWLDPARFLPAAWAWPIGILLVVAALVLFGWAVDIMRRGGASVPTNEPTDAIVERGPFTVSRNPIYLSMALLLLGIGFWANSVWFLALAGVAVILLTQGVIVREERYLERKFGETYLAYKRRVRRWI